MKKSILVVSSLILFCLIVSSLIVSSIFSSALGENRYFSSAESMALLDASDNSIIAEINSTKRLPMASTTKIVTAITVIEREQDLERIVEVPAKAANVEGSSIYLRAGDRLKIIDLLYGLLLQSGNDCAETLAIVTSGSVNQFAKNMNDFAKKLNLTNSNFVNPHGLHDNNHFTTSYDLAVITSYALKNPIFKKIVATKKYTFCLDGETQNRVILNKNKMLNNFNGGDGVKTGYTKKAGRCLVSSATRQGKQLICVVLNCAPMFEDCSRLLEEGFKIFTERKIVDKNTFIATFKAINCNKPCINGSVMRDIVLYAKDNEYKKMEIVSQLNPKLIFPIKKGDEIGKIKIYASKQLLFEEKLYSIEDVEQSSYFDTLLRIAKDWNL